MSEQIYPIRTIQQLDNDALSNSPEAMEALGLEITLSLYSVFRSNIQPYHAWITPYAVSIDFLVVLEFPSLQLQGRCYTNVSQEVPGVFSIGCTVIPFMDGKRFTKVGDPFPSTIYLSLDRGPTGRYWSYGKYLEDYAEFWDAESPIEIKNGHYTRELVDF